MSTDTNFDGSVGFNGRVEKDRAGARVIRTWEAPSIGFAALGSGASDSILLGDGTGRPAGSFTFCGASAKAGTPDFAGEADLAVQLGFEGGDTDGFVASTNLNATGDGLEITVLPGVIKAGQVVTAAQNATIAALFTATELDDVTAGSITWRIFYYEQYE